MTLVRFFPLEAAENRWFDRLRIVHEQPLSALLLGAALLYRPKFFDILPMYILLVLAVPSLIAYLMARLLQTSPDLFRWRWLAFLGKHSLPVFTYHVLILYLLEFFVREPIAQQGHGPILTLSLLFVLSLALPAGAHRYYSQRKIREQTMLTYRAEGN